MKVQGPSGVVVDVPEALATGLIAAGHATAAPTRKPVRQK